MVNVLATVQSGPGARQTLVRSPSLSRTIGVMTDVVTVGPYEWNAIPAGAPHPDGGDGPGVADAFVHWAASYDLPYLAPDTTPVYTAAPVPTQGDWVFTEGQNLQYGTYSRIYTWQYVTPWDGVRQWNSEYDPGFPGYFGVNPMGHLGPIVPQAFTCTYVAVGPSATARAINRANTDLAVWLQASTTNGSDAIYNPDVLPAGPDIMYTEVDWGDGTVERTSDLTVSPVPNTTDPYAPREYGYPHVYDKPGAYTITFHVVCRDIGFDVYVPLTITLVPGTPTPVPDPPAPDPDPDPDPPTPPLGPTAKPSGVMGRPTVWLSPTY